jgi:lipopolysaccharide/colanic/teichoic acid biosynthesis glycosyltransferase
VEGVTLLGINPPVLGRSSRVMKRCLDIAGAAVLGLFLMPLLIGVAVAIKLDSPGPVFFRQRRVGKGSERFNVLKFRTMHVDAEARREELLAQSIDPNWLHLENDPRITRVGRKVRHLSLDELPQLWNVLKGEMSLVGPRPLIESEDEMVGGWGRSRLDLTPGLTGVWQVLGRTNIPFDEMVKLDYLYVTNWSLWTDIRLLLRTPVAVFTRRGAN